MPSPCVSMPQPEPCVSATTPSTFGKCRERARRVKCVGDAARDGRRAIHRRQDADVVARRHAPVGADDALNVAGGSTYCVGFTSAPNA